MKICTTLGTAFSQYILNCKLLKVSAFFLIERSRLFQGICEDCADKLNDLKSPGIPFPSDILLNFVHFRE